MSKLDIRFLISTSRIIYARERVGPALSDSKDNEQWRYNLNVSIFTSLKVSILLLEAKVRVKGLTHMWGRINNGNEMYRLKEPYANIMKTKLTTTIRTEDSMHMATMRL